MPPHLLFPLTGIDLEKDLYDQATIRLANPQRGDMEHLNGIVYSEPSLMRMIGYKDVKDNEFWVPGHIPGRPLLPGVIMLETAAQLASYYTRTIDKWTGFIGFGGVVDCKFRLPVTPGNRMYILAQKIWERHGRTCCKTQGMVNGQITFEASIIGTRV